MAIDELAPGNSHERQARAAAWAGGAGNGGRGGARPQGERMTILGIDPGAHGAIAVPVSNVEERFEQAKNPAGVPPGLCHNL